MSTLERRNKVGHRTVRSKAVPNYKLNDVVVTNAEVPAFDNRGKKSGTALPGWKWRIVAVEVEEYVVGKRVKERVFYKVVSDSAPMMYHQRLSEKKIARKV